MLYCSDLVGRAPRVTFNLSEDYAVDPSFGRPSLLPQIVLLLQVALVQWRQYLDILSRPPGWRGQCEAWPGDEAAAQAGDGGHVGEEQGAVQPQVQVRPR